MILNLSGNVGSSTTKGLKSQHHPCAGQQYPLKQLNISGAEMVKTVRKVCVAGSELRLGMVSLSTR